MKRIKFILLTLTLLLNSFVFSQEKQLFNGPGRGFQTLLKQKTSAAPSTKTSSASMPGESVNYYWDFSNATWLYADSSFYTYNNLGLLTNETRRDGIQYSRNLNTYNAQGRLTENLYQSWDVTNNMWQNSSRNVYVFDMNDNEIEYRFEIYNTTTNLWETSFGDKRVITYSKGLEIDIVFLNWDMATNTWEDFFRLTNYQYGQGNLLQQYDFQVKNGNTWDNNSRYVDTYNSQNQLLTEVVQTWSLNSFVDLYKYKDFVWHNWCGNCKDNMVASYTGQIWNAGIKQWTDDFRANSTYDSFGNNTTTNESYVNNSWEKTSRFSEFVDEHFNQAGMRGELWLSATNTWSLDFENKISPNYDSGGNINQSIWQYLDSSLPVPELVNSEKKVYSEYKTLTGFESSTEEKLGISVFPNPFSTICTIHFDEWNGDLEPVLAIYDLNGKLVYQSKITEQDSKIERGNLLKGIYLYHVYDNKNLSIKGKLAVQ